MKLLRGVAIAFAVVVVLIIIAADDGLLNGMLLWLNTVPFADTLGHFLLLGMLSFLFSLSFPYRPVQAGPLTLRRTSLLIAVVITLEEFSQVFFSTRTFSLTDLAANYAGIWLFGWLGGLLKKRFLSYPPKEDLP